MSSPRFCLTCSVVFFAISLDAGQSCLAPEAIWRMRSISDAQIAPDSKSVVYVMSWNDEMDDTGYSNLWQIAIDGDNPLQVSEGKYHDNNPRWSPDGTQIAYITDRGGAGSIHIRSLTSGEDRIVLPGHESVSNLAWSPDGKYLAYMSFTPSEPSWAPPMPAKPPGAHWASPAVAITELRWTLDGIGVLKPGANRIFVVPAGGGEPHQVSRAPYQHTFYIGEPDVAWSRDSRFVLAPAVDALDGWAVYDGNQIYAFPVDGGKPRQLTNLKGYGLQMRPSPDASLVAFAGYDWKGQSYHVNKLSVVDANGGESREITTKWDRDVTNPVWASDSKHVYYLSDDRGNVNLYQTDLQGSTKQITKGSERLVSFSSSLSKAAFIYSTPTQPAVLGVVSLGVEERPKIIFDPNREQMSHCALSRAEEIWYSSFDGTKIQGWILKPSGFSAGSRYPLLVSIHGGPHGAYGNAFTLDLQAFADHGYVVLYTNPRGSTGYGEAFGNIIQHKWPGDDIKDVLAGVDAIVSKGYVDSGRMAVIGGSGGGLMTAWMVGHTDRFRAAVAMYPVTNWFSHVGSADNGFYIASVYRKGMPWEYPEDYISHSPLFYAKSIKTPTLIITGDEDWRTPIAQSQEFFRALKVRGVDTALVRVPGESHGIRKRPSHQIATLVYSMAWLDRYIFPQTH